MKAELFTAHPATGQLAEDFGPDKLRWKTSVQLAIERRRGAKYYWCRHADHHIDRVELKNYAFVVYCMGDDLFIDGVQVDAHALIKDVQGLQQIVDIVKAQGGPV